VEAQSDHGALCLPNLRRRVADGDYANMLIDDPFRECVCFLCVETTNQSGDAVKEERATGFFVGVYLGTKNDAAVAYLVTARHVIEESRSCGTLYAKINLKAGGVDYIPVPQDAWTAHLSTDVAIVPIPLKEDYRFKWVRSDGFADDNYILHNGVHTGDEVFLIGLFAGYGGDDQAEPIARFAHVALGLKKISLRLNSGSLPVKVDAYLVETTSWGGESGSPVFHCKWPVSNRVPISMGNPRLLGLLHGHFEISQNVTGGGTVGLNSGIGIVIPSHAIQECLMHPDFVAEREKRKQKIESDVNTQTLNTAKGKWIYGNS